MPENSSMGERIYEHYLQYGKTRKKLSRRQFTKRYGHKLKRKTPTYMATADKERQLRRSLSEKDIARLRD